MAAPQPLFSTLAANAGYWDHHGYDYPTLLAQVDGTSANDRNAARDAILNAAQDSPILLAFTTREDPDHIHVGHSPSIFPTRLGSPTPFDGCVTVTLGDDLRTAYGYVLDITAFARNQNHPCATMDVITGDRKSVV